LKKDAPVPVPESHATPSWSSMYIILIVL
jgi:hypothetical protein